MIVICEDFVKYNAHLVQQGAPAPHGDNRPLEFKL